MNAGMSAISFSGTDGFIQSPRRFNIHDMLNLIICSYSDKLGGLMLFQIGSSIVFMETYEIKT